MRLQTAHKLPPIIMDPLRGGSATPADGLNSVTPAAAMSRWAFTFSQQYQHLLDRSTPYVLYRWITFLFIAFVYVLRVYLIQGFYVVTYALGIYILNLLIGFLSPQVDPEFSDGPTLPTRGSDEFRPFVRRLPEFKFCYYFLGTLVFLYLVLPIFFLCIKSSPHTVLATLIVVIAIAMVLLRLLFLPCSIRYSITKAFSIAFVLTFFSIFDVPVFWPILVFYWIILCMLTLRRQILHMIKYKYVPFSVGKQRYDRKSAPSADNERLPS